MVEYLRGVDHNRRGQLLAAVVAEVRQYAAGNGGGGQGKAVCMQLAMVVVAEVRRYGRSHIL